MKVFIPMPDEVLVQPVPVDGQLVPFNPEFLIENQRVKDRKPRNWISDNDYSSACERLRQNYATA